MQRAQALFELADPAVEPLLGDLLERLKDINWPVARTLQPVLAGIGARLAGDVRRILKSDDDIWKLWVLTHVVAHSAGLAELLKPELARLSAAPTPGERQEEVDIIAAELLAGL